MDTPTSGTARASNFELLRILAMLLILVLHANFLAFRFPTNEAIHSQPLTSLGQVWSEALAIVGVNIFVLISGYFGIKARIKGIVSLLFQAFFYTVGVYSTLVLLGLEPFSLSEFMGSLIPLNRKSEWFLPTYLSLMIFSPLLNALAQRTSEQELRRYLLLFFLVEFVLGFINDQLEVKDGYSLFAFSGIYLIGRYLRLYPQRLERRNGRTFLLGYLGLTFVQSLALFLLCLRDGAVHCSEPACLQVHELRFPDQHPRSRTALPRLLSDQATECRSKLGGFIDSCRLPHPLQCTTHRAIYGICAGAE